MRFEDRVKTLFDSVVTRPASDWERLVAESVHDDSVKAEVRRLLEFHSKTTGFLSRPAAETYPSMVRSVGSRLGEFTLTREIGRGGMGIVYLAEDSVLGRTVALKILASQALSSEHDLARFRTEAKAAARLSHPGIVPVYRYGEQDGTHYIVMEYVEGETLADRIERIRREAPHPEARTRQGSSGTAGADLRAVTNDRHVREILLILASVADALDYAHRHNVIHRDVKPSNILLTLQGEPRLTDFGVARIGVDQSITVTGEMAGTYYYMSPEQAKAQHKQIDHRTDIFSLGVVLYECLTLRRPFTGESSHQVLVALTSTDPLPIRQLNPSVSRDLATVCHKALEKRPIDRYPMAAHLAADLRCCLNGEPILASPPGLLRVSSRVIRRHRVAFVVACIALMSSGIAALSWALRLERERSLSWIDVESQPPGARVVIERIDAATLEPVPQPRRLGKTPLRSASLEPGQYRVTVKDAGSDAFVEFNLLLTKTGRESTMRLVVSTDPSTWPDPGTGLGGVPTPSTVHEDMVRIDAGQYTRGTEGETRGLLKSASVSLRAFWIDTHEVSNAEYKAFVEATGHREPQTWTAFGWESSVAALPVVGVNLEDAEAFARWKGKRLPTISEWQAAARGHEARVYPWGDDPNGAPSGFDPPADLAVQEAEMSAAELWQSYRRHARATAAPDPEPGQVPCVGVFSNVRELVGTVDLDNLDQVVVGRCWSDPVARAPLSHVWTAPLGSFSIRHGFRCAQSAEPAGIFIPSR